jgi:GT2 family glycosyltransferase
MSMGPDVSVVIPTYKREREVVLAVRSALAQPAVSLEVIVLDDTADGTARAAVESIHDPRVRYIVRPVPSRGVPALVRNDGAAVAQGTFFHFLDDDDRLVDGALAAMVGALERSGAGVGIGYVLPFGDHAEVLAQQRRYFERARKWARTRRTRFDMTSFLLFRTTLLVNSACIVRRECFERAGGYDPNVFRCEDVDFYLRAIRACGFAYVDRPVLHYRTGQSSLMHDLVDNSKVSESYRVIHTKYRRAHGVAEFYALKALASLPFPLQEPPAASSPPDEEATSLGKPPPGGVAEK